MRWKRSMACRFVGVTILVLVASLGAVAVLSGLSPKGLLRLMTAWITPSRPTVRLPLAVAAQQEVPLYSDVWYDDSGISSAIDFEAPVTDPTSLSQVGAAQGAG